jgi:putative transposase
MGLPRSTFYDAPVAHLGDAEIVGRMQVICDEFEAYGYRRVGAELRHQGIIVNHKKIRRLMREHELQPRRRRRYVVTTDSDHDSPIFPDRARDLVVDGPNQLWVADITYIAITAGFVYLAAILDAWSRRAVGYAISRSIDARLAAAALKAAIRVRRPPKGCVHHSDRGSQGGFKRSSQHPDEGGCDEELQAAFGSIWAGTIVVTGSTAGGRTR